MQLLAHVNTGKEKEGKKKNTEMLGGRDLLLVKKAETEIKQTGRNPGGKGKCDWHNRVG